MDIDNNSFYNGFQTEYFSYKTDLIMKALNDETIHKVMNSSDSFDEEKYIRTLKSDLRQTTFHAIETFFELFFAFIPSKTEEFSENIIQRITHSSLPYERIRKIADETISLDSLLDEKVTDEKNIETTIANNIFFFGLNDREEFVNNIDVSVKKIKNYIIDLAQEFSDRKEYNSYKHGLRIISRLQGMSIKNLSREMEKIEIDLSDSVSFYSYDKKNKRTSYRTKVFDSERDNSIIGLCSALIWNMIKLRDYYFNKDYYTNGLDVHFFTNDFDFFETHVDVDNYVYNIDQGIK